MPSVDVVPGIDPLPRLLVFQQARVQPPVDAVPVQVHELPPVDSEPGHGSEALVQSHPHREVGVGQQAAEIPGASPALAAGFIPPTPAVVCRAIPGAYV